MLSKGDIPVYGFLASAASNIHIAKINRSQGVLGSNLIWSLDFFPSSHLTLCISMALYSKTSSLRRLAGCISDILP